MKLPSTAAAWYVRAAAIFVILMTAAALFGLARLGFDDDYRDIFRSPDERFANLQLLDETFGAGHADLVNYMVAKDMLSRRSLEVLRETHRRIGDLPAVEVVVSPFSARRTKRVGRLFLPLLPGDDASDEQLDRARREVDDHPLVAGRLLSQDHQAALLLIRLKSEVRSLDEVEAAIAEIKAIAADCAAGSDVMTRITGMPAIRVETVRRIQHEHLLITGGGIVLAAIVAWLLLRNLAAVVLVVAPALLGILWTVGALGLGGQNIDAINVVLPALVMVIGIADSIHVMFHFREHRATGLEPRAAMGRAVRELCGACSVTAVTTSIGFLSLLVSDDRIIGRFGVYGGIGVLLSFAAVMTSLPLLAATRLGRAAAMPSNRSSNGATTDEDRPAWPDRIIDFLAPRCGRTAVVLVVATGAMLYVSRGLEADYRFLENLTESSESFATMEQVEAKFGGAPLLQVLVEWPADRELRSPETLQVLTAVHDVVEQNPAASAPLSILTVLQSLPGQGDDLAAQNDLAARFGELKHLPADRLRSLVQEDRRLALVTAYIPDAGAAALQAPLAALEAALADVQRAHPGYRLRPTGFAIVSTFRTRPMIMGLFEGLSMEIVVIFVVISVLLRSPVVGLLSLPSNLFPLLATVATILLLGWKLQYATVLALNICLGIAVDDTVHFLSRYKQELRLGRDRRTAVRHSFRAVAPVMLTTTILMLTGFGAGLFCTIPTIRAFSAGSCLALLFALASEAIVLPTLLLCLADLAERRSAKSPTVTLSPTA